MLGIATIVQSKHGEQGVLDEVATHSAVVHSTGGWPSVWTFLDFAVGVTSPFNCLCISNWSVCTYATTVATNVHLLIAFADEDTLQEFLLVSR